MQGENHEVGMILAEGPQVTKATAISQDDVELEKTVQLRVCQPQLLQYFALLIML